MVAKIISGKSLIGALNYNENKVNQSKAELVSQNGYAKDFHLLNFNDKLIRLKDLSERNQRASTNTVHISLNFAIGEQLTKEKLSDIANDYMERIGFVNQPYLVYLHRDAGHPHIHIVSTNIQSSGERISLHNLGKTKSEAARKAIEITYRLIPAEKQKYLQKQISHSLVKAEYGKTDTKRAITNIVNSVVAHYKFSSIHEYNAVLGQYNVMADRGSKESKMFAKNGLVYWVLDEKNNKIGIPIKASSIYNKPTLKNLEAKFGQNEILKKSLKEQVKSQIDQVLMTKATQAGFKHSLLSKGIQVIYRQNESRLYGVTFIDNNLKAVFNGSDLGKSYSAAALSEWFTKSPMKEVKETPSNVIVFNPRETHSNHVAAVEYRNTTGKIVLSDLLKTEYQDGYTMPQIQNKRKKKRKRLSN